MAIQTETYYSVMYDDEEVDKIGLSDTLDNYTAEEIQAYMLCGCRDKLLGGNLGLYNAGGGSYDVWNSGTPFATGTVDHTYMHMFNGNGDNSTADLQGRYCGTVLLTDDLAAFPLCVTSANIANFKLITELDIKNYCMNISATLTQKGGIGATDLSDKTNTLYCVEIDLASLFYRYGTPPVDIAVTLAVVPYHVFEIAGELFMVNGYKTNKLGFSCRLAPNRNAGMEIYPISSNADDDSYSLAFNNLGFGDDYSDYESNTYAWAYGYDTVNKFGSTDAELWYQCYFGILMFDVRYYYKNYDQMMMQFANTGLLFKVDGTIYKPLISDNVVYGYTDNLDAESDIDNWERDTKHDIPVTPPTPPTPPPTDGDDIDDHKMGAGSQLSGIAQLWVLTRAQLIALHAAFANAPVNYDPMSSFISVMGVGISVLRVVGDSMPWTLNPINIKMSNGETWHTGVEGHIVDKQVSAFNEVNIRVQRRYNNFLDYSPYATHEIFLPMCGWITLPDIAVDRGITVTYIPDIETLKVRAVVSVVDDSGNRCVIGEKDGVMGAEIPFTNIGHSLFLGNTVVQSADIAGEIVTGAIGAGFTKTNAQGGKFRPYEGFTVGMAGTLPGAIGNALVSGNVNRTHFTTGNGTRIGFGDGENIQIKSIYHRIDKPNNYDHTVGRVCNKTDKLSEFTGFTVCDNPHINFSATEREKEEIKQLLEQGVIL